MQSIIYVCLHVIATRGLEPNRKGRLWLVSEPEAEAVPNEQTKMASQEDSVREFVAVTDVDEERARFFLESAGWNLQVRVLHGRCPWLRCSAGCKVRQHNCERVSTPANVSVILPVISASH